MFLKEDITNSIVINKSEFITYLCRIKSEEEYRVKLAELKKKHYDATHVCSALITKDTVRSSDDGEPSGTAGVPILTVLQRNEMEETAEYLAEKADRAAERINDYIESELKENESDK